MNLSMRNSQIQNVDCSTRSYGWALIEQCFMFGNFSRNDAPHNRRRANNKSYNDAGPGTYQGEYAFVNISLFGQILSNEELMICSDRNRLDHHIHTRRSISSFEMLNYSQRAHWLESKYFP